MSDDGVGAEAYFYEEFRLIFLLYVKDFGGNRRDGRCGLNETEFMFWIRMSDDGMGAKAYSHEEMRKLDSFCYCMYTILVVTGEMVDVENEAYFLIVW